jgi:hypothetical protein
VFEGIRSGAEIVGAVLGVDAGGARLSLESLPTAGKYDAGAAAREIEFIELNEVHRA